MKQKTDPPKPVHVIKHGRVHFCYVIGLSYIQIWTDMKTDWPEMPEYFRVCFSIETPNEIDYLKHSFFPSLEAEKIVLRAIKKKIAEQRKAGTSAKLEALKEVSRGREGKTRQEEFLPFE